MTPEEIISWIGVAFAIVMFVSPIQTLRVMWREDTVGPRTINFFCVTCLVSVMWIAYAILISSPPLLSCNCVGCGVHGFGIVFFLRLSFTEERRGRVLSQTSFAAAARTTVAVAALAVIGCVIAGVVERPTATIVLGSCAAGGSLLQFAAPLDVVRNICITKCSQALTPFTVVGTLADTATWSLYGLLVKDWFIFAPNFAGLVLSIAQALLLGIFPRESPTKEPTSNNEPISVVDTSARTVIGEVELAPGGGKQQTRTKHC